MAQLRKNKRLDPSLNEGGYDYKFIEEPADSLKCLICLLVVREPQQHGGCGKLFCKVCINKHKIFRNDCPTCRQPLNNSNGFPTIFNDFRSKRLDYNHVWKTVNINTSFVTRKKRCIMSVLTTINTAHTHMHMQVIKKSSL